MGSQTTLANNEIRYIMKVIKSLENRGILIKETTRKTTSQEGGFLNFVRPSMKAALPLVKSVFIPLAKSALIPLGLSAGSCRCSFSKENWWIRHNSNSNFKWSNGK